MVIQKPLCPDLELPEITAPIGYLAGARPLAAGYYCLYILLADTEGGWHRVAVHTKWHRSWE